MSPESVLQKVVRYWFWCRGGSANATTGGKSGNFPPSLDPNFSGSSVSFGSIVGEGTTMSSPSFSHLTYEGELYGICNYR